MCLDGDLDVVTKDLLVYLNGGGRTGFSAGANNTMQLYSLGSFPNFPSISAHAFADVDGDGDADLISLLRTDSASISNYDLACFINDGTGVLTLSERSGLGRVSASSTLVLGDFDADRCEAAAFEPFQGQLVATDSL